MITDICAGKRPSRPKGSSKSQWLQDPVWGVITTGWHNQANQRCELSIMYQVFSPSSQQGVQNSKPGDLYTQNNTRNNVNPTITETPPTPKRQLGDILPRFASFFQFLQNPESEIQRRVDEMNEVSLATFPLQS